MQSLRLLLALASAALASQVQVTPVQKVVQLLENMKEKGTKEMQEEEVQYTKFKQFCDMTLAEKEAAIGEAADKIETLEADIEKAASEAERLGKEMSEHQTDIEAATAEKEKATGVREKGRTDFQLTLKDYGESIDAIARALKALKEEDKKTALLQLADAKLLPEEARQSLLDIQGPAPKTYEFQSGGVISMLEGLQDKFVDERISLEKEEQKKRHAFEMLVQSLEAQLAQSKKEQEEKGQFKAKQLQSKASSEGDLGETKVEKQSDEKYSTDLKATCSKKAAAFAARQKLRQEEIEAIEKAKGIIAGGAVAGSAEKHLPSLLQASPKRTALAFLRSEVREPQSESSRVARFLQQRAAALNSRVLSAVAGRAAADPIAKVRTMIEQLITKMQTQQNEEASKNGWCNAELASNKATREEKTDAVDELSSDADELSTAIGKLGEEVSALAKQVSELEADMAKATQMREEESAKNAATVKDAKEAQAAVAQALLVLRDFYKKAAGASSLLQTRHGEARAEPEVFGDEPYTGMGGESGGVISMLEVIQSDFAQLQAETEAAEESGLKEYQEFMEDSKVDKATKVRTSEHKTSKKQAKTQELTAVRADLQGTQKELDAAKAYFEKLRPDCLDTGASYAERQAQRKQEVADLQEALEMLEKELPGTTFAQVPRLISLVRAVDSTGTLMRVRRPIGDLYADALHRVRPDVQVSAREMTRVFPAAFSRQSTLSPGFGAGGCGCRDWWRAVVEGTMGGAGIAVSDLGESFEAVFDDLYGHVFCGQEAWELLPGTVTSLESLRRWCAANDCRLGVMSNMDDRLSVILQNLGILDKFDFVLTSYEARAVLPAEFRMWT
ncbi:hdhd3 [Symbiodinium sp. CCMP2592]|nr:hdhd3 [Symbiodinium sp. CCMP2592]